MKYSYSKCCWNWIYCWQIRDERLSRLQILLQGEIFTVWQFLSCENFSDVPLWRHTTTAPKSPKIHKIRNLIRIWGVRQAFWSVHMKVSDLAKETKLKEETMNGSLLVAYCCTTIFLVIWVWKSINQCREPTDTMTKITELGNCLLFWATCKFIIFRWPPRPNWLHVGYCIGWPSKVAGKLKAWREIGFLKVPSSRMRKIFAKLNIFCFRRRVLSKT